MMTLHDVLYAIGINGDEDIEVCREGEGWEDYDTLKTHSTLLKPFYNCKIKCIGAVKNNIRVDIDWNMEEQTNDQN